MKSPFEINPAKHILLSELKEFEKALADANTAYFDAQKEVLRLKEIIASIERAMTII